MSGSKCTHKELHSTTVNVCLKVWLLNDNKLFAEEGFAASLRSLEGTVLSAPVAVISLTAWQLNLALITRVNVVHLHIQQLSQR